MNYWAYMRKSTKRQKFTSQRSRIEQWLRQNKKVLFATYVDDCPGQTPIDQRNLGYLINKRIRHGDFIIVSDFSRLARDIFVAMEILSKCYKRDVKIILAYDNRVLDLKDPLTRMDVLMMMYHAERFSIEQSMKIKQVWNEKHHVPNERSPKKERKLILDECRDDVIALYELGMPMTKIAEEFAVSRYTVAYSLTKWGVLRKIPGEKFETSRDYHAILPKGSYKTIGGEER